MTDSRPSPDDLLAAISADEDPSRLRGSLRVYLGMCPGVGKTYTMLEDARRLHAAGGNVLVGFVETHDRVETAALLDQLPILPRRASVHRGATLEEFDLDAALARRPSLVLVDELAHTNTPDSRHPKRWQDVRELLDAGIDVWTTVNIQHLESLRDAVSAITGIVVQETVPDAFFDQAADEVRVIDLPPDQLRERLAAGKVYLGDRAVAAATGFFREGNLRALRELALRFTARKADAQKRRYMSRHLIDGPWRSGERLLVAVGPSPYSERLIRITRRLADAHDATWIAVHVETGAALDEDSRQRLVSHLALARSLGAELVSTSDPHTVRGLLAIARREHVTQIVAGKPVDRSVWSRLRGNDIAERLQRQSGDIDILLVHPGAADHLRPGPAPLTAPAAEGSHLLTGLRTVLGTLLIATVAGAFLEKVVGYRSVALLYLLGVVIAGLSLSRPAVLALAVAAGLSWNFFFTTPRLSLAMLETGDFLQLVTLLAVALVVGHLTARLRAQVLASRDDEERARALYQLTRVTSASVSLAHAAPAALRQVEAVFHAPATLLLPAPDGTIQVHSGAALEPAALSVCQWTFDHARPAGRTTDTLPEAAVLALPLPVAGRSAGVLALRPSNHALRSPLLRDLLETFATHLCVLLEKEDYQRAAREARVADESRQFQRALLDHVSHEIKTPVAVIQSATHHLLATPAPAPSDSTTLLRELAEAARRLDRVFTQLITLSRAEAGLVEPRPDVCDARDLLHEVATTCGLGDDVVDAGEFTFRTDPDLLRTALVNLAHNALQHGGGAVTLSARQEAGRTVLRVANAGPPIPPEEQGVLFDRFARGTQAKPGGLGLGLPIARQFVHMLGGDLRLESSDARGTVFTITLP